MSFMFNILSALLMYVNTVLFIKCLKIVKRISLDTYNIDQNAKQQYKIMPKNSVAAKLLVVSNTRKILKTEHLFNIDNMSG